MRIICTLPNAAELINGVAFLAHEAGRLSEEIADEVAEAFLAIPGYAKHEAVAQAAGGTIVTIDLDTLRTDLAAEAAAEDAAPAVATKRRAATK